MKYAVNSLEYKVTVHESLLYQKGLGIFEKYVSEIGGIKQSSTGGAKRHIHKLLRNALYGRMGMSSERNIVKILVFSCGGYPLTQRSRDTLAKTRMPTTKKKA